ncbi:MAG TPA: RNA polymerase sigma factor [Tepidisphaeraceae bacterium]|nr:RNA polymerase sigma factor [Tepidisphaeraceae bacterium]
MMGFRDFEEVAVLYMSTPSAGHNFDPAEKIKNLFNAPNPPTVSDAESRPLRRRNGVSVNRDTFGRLVLEHIPAAQRFAIRLCGNVDAAEEIVQEALLNASKSWKSYRGDATFKTWLFQIVVNAFRDHCRKVSKHQTLPQEISDANSASPTRQIEAQELGSALATMIQLLPERQREVLVLSVYEMQNSANIAAVLGISEQNVRTNLHLARQRMKELLAPFLAESGL